MKRYYLLAGGLAVLAIAALIVSLTILSVGDGIERLFAWFGISHFDKEDK